MTGHTVKSVKKDGRVIIVMCECGDTFDSIESKGLALSYHSKHVKKASLCPTSGILEHKFREGKCIHCEVTP